MMEKDLELMLEELYYKTDGIIGRKLLDQIILEAYELQETGRGMTYRGSGDKFEKTIPEKIWPNINTLYFLSSVVLNGGGKGSFSKKEETVEAINKLIKTQKIKVKEYNRPNTAAILVIMGDDAQTPKQKFGFIRYFENLTNDARGKWSQANFKKDTGYEILSDPGERISNTEAEGIKIKPTDLILDEVARTPSDTAMKAIETAKTLVKNKLLDRTILNNLNELFSAALAGREPEKLVNGAKYAVVYEKYLGEILGSIAFVKNWKINGTDRAEVEKVVLSGTREKISNMKISFIMSSNEKLIDSTLTSKKGKKIFLSSKAETGAASSLVRFNEELKKFEEKELELFETQFPNFVYVLRTIASKTWWDGPIDLALNQYRLIDTNDLLILEDIKNDLNMPLDKFNRKYNRKLTRNLKELKKKMAADEKTAGYLPAFHLISGIARAVVEKINSTPEFHNGVKEMMNRIGVVQLNCNRFEVEGDDCKFSSFNVKYPPVFKGIILADAKKNYMSTYNNGRITFKVPNT